MRHRLPVLLLPLTLVAPLAAQSNPTSARTPTPRPAVVRGLYVNRWAANGPKMWALIDVAKRTEVNALVLDVKDDRGYLLYRSSVPLARAIGADRHTPMPANRLRAVLDTMRAHGIHPIARIVVAKDPMLANAKREWAVQRRADGKPWLDSHGNPWLDPHQRGVWTYAADLADEAVRLGFAEVQYDYVRFPDERRLLSEARFPLANGRRRDAVIRDQLGYLRARLAPLGALMAIDVFGATTTIDNDMGIGQTWEQFADRADVVLPMTYPSHYPRGSYGIAHPNAEPYAVLDRALRGARVRNRGVKNAGEIVPWYQDFTMGKPRYGVPQLRAQMQAGYDNGMFSWMLWNAGSRYTVKALRPDILDPREESPRWLARLASDTAAPPAVIAPLRTSPAAPPDTARPVPPPR
ncbi:MAG TPA: putative glycoside hydrolase [Gemmatimonadaceae bacterium]|nr:putative glycoside hydrolase [Gemmatimonadaceae bacterium]